MVILSSSQIDISSYGYESHPCVWALHVQINHTNFPAEAKSIVDELSNTSWLKKLDEIDYAAYEARMQDTLNNIVGPIEEGAREGAAKEMVTVFMEYLVSMNAKRALVRMGHKNIPLAELWKEKASGNPGFDFHTISPQKMLVFGEAKYTRKSSPYKNAIDQVAKFIRERKHIKELSDLKKFSLSPAKKVLKGQMGVAIAFSVKKGKADLRIDQTIRNSAFVKLLDNNEVYILAVEII